MTPCGYSITLGDRLLTKSMRDQCSEAQRSRGRALKKKNSLPDHQPNRDPPRPEHKSLIETRDTTPADGASVTIEVSSKHAYQSHLVSVFAQTYFANAEHMSPMIPPILEQWRGTLPTSLEIARDTLCLLALGYREQDTRVDLAGRTRRAWTLATLRRNLDQSTGDFVSVIGITTMLSSIDLFAGSSAPEDAWKWHLKGLYAILVARERVGATLPHEALLIRQMRHLCFMCALLSPDDVQYHRHFPALTCAVPGDYDDLMGILAILPSTLHAVRAPGLTPGVAIHLCRILRDTEVKLGQWHFDFHGGSFPVHCASQEVMMMSTEADTVVDTVGNESLFTPLIWHTFYWTCRLLIQAGLLIAERQFLGTSDSTAADIVARGNELEWLLWRSIPGLWASAGSRVSQSIAVRGIFYFAQEWCRQSGNTASELAWREREMRYRRHATGLHWNAMLPWTFHTLYWIT